MLGDYRDNSLDSRFFGFVDRSAIVGKAVYVYWSNDFSRVGTSLQGQNNAN
jgi:signal peptidase I